MQGRCQPKRSGLFGDAAPGLTSGGIYTQIGSSLAGSAVQAALAYSEGLRDHHAPMLRAANMQELRLVFGTRNMILTAEMKLRASLMRTENRRSHYLLDYPEVDDENWRACINIHKGDDGSMQLGKQGFDVWPG